MSKKEDYHEYQARMTQFLLDSIDVNKAMEKHNLVVTSFEIERFAESLAKTAYRFNCVEKNRMDESDQMLLVFLSIISVLGTVIMLITSGPWWALGLGSFMGLFCYSVYLDTSGKSVKFFRKFFRKD